MFKILIQGRTIEELKANMGLMSNELFQRVTITNPAIPEPALLDEEEQEDFLTQAAAQPAVTLSKSAPSVSEPIISAAPTPANEADVDTKGMPYDERIHSSSRAINKDGSWRYRRGLEAPTIKKVEQELIAQLKADASQAEHESSRPVTLPPVPAIPQAVHVPTPATPIIPAPTPVQVVPQAPPPMPAPEPVLPHAHTVETFKKNLVPVLAKLVKDGKLTMEYVNQLKAHFGVDEIYKVNEQQAEEMFNNFVQYGMIAKV